MDEFLEACHGPAMLIVHVADLHLDSPMRGLDQYEDCPSEAFRAATRGAFEKLIEECIYPRAQLLIIAGDLFDGSWDDAHTALYMSRQLARLAEAKVQVVLVKGNHDAESRLIERLPDSGQKIFSSERAETIRFDEYGVAVHGQSYSERDVKKNLGAHYPAPVAGYFNIGVLHTALEGRAGHANYAPCTVAELQSLGYDYWALGHVHQYEEVCSEPLIVFPGNLQGRHAKETGEKGAVFFEVEDGKLIHKEFVPMDVCRWEFLKIDLSKGRPGQNWQSLFANQLSEAVAAAGGRRLAVRVELCGATEFHQELFRDEAAVVETIRQYAQQQLADDGSAVVWIEKVKINTTMPDLNHATSEKIDLDGLGSELRKIAESGDIPEELRQRWEEIQNKLPPELLKPMKSNGSFSTEDDWDLQELMTEAMMQLQALARAQGER